MSISRMSRGGDQRLGDVGGQRASDIWNFRPQLPRKRTPAGSPPPPENARVVLTGSPARTSPAPGPRKDPNPPRNYLASPGGSLCIRQRDWGIPHHAQDDCARHHRGAADRCSYHRGDQAAQTRSGRTPLGCTNRSPSRHPAKITRRDGAALRISAAMSGRRFPPPWYVERRERIRAFVYRGPFAGGFDKSFLSVS